MELTDEIADAIINEIALVIKFKKMTNEELVKEAISTYCDYTMHPIVEEMMNRLDPDWAGSDEEEQKTPPNGIREIEKGK